ncbi:MAG: hypothetical protein ACUVQP_12285 [Bacteroidales bacterium]
MRSKTIVILGGGIGGIITVNKLRHKLAREHKVILIGGNPVHFFAPSFLWLNVEEHKPKEIKAPVKSLLCSGIQVVEEEVESIDNSNSPKLPSATSFIRKMLYAIRLHAAILRNLINMETHTLKRRN